jgi:hypothetical protein
MCGDLPLLPQFAFVAYTVFNPLTYIPELWLVLFYQLTVWACMHLTCAGFVSSTILLNHASCLAGQGVNLSTGRQMYCFFFAHFSHTPGESRYVLNRPRQILSVSLPCVSNVMEQSYSWANMSTARPEIHRIARNPNVHRRCHKISQLALNLSEISTVHTLPTA